MQLKYKGNVSTWGIVAISLHWILAVLLFFQFASGIRLSTLNFSSSKLELIDMHQSFGSIIMILVFIRIAWRFYNTKPENNSLPNYHKILSQITHMLVYFLLFKIRVFKIIVDLLIE